MTHDIGSPAGTAPSSKRARGKTALTKPAVPTATSKLEQLVMLLSRPEGATLGELVAATGWQRHSVRGALAGALTRKGHVIRSEKLDGERRYRIGGGA